MSLTEAQQDAINDANLAKSTDQRIIDAFLVSVPYLADTAITRDAVVTMLDSIGLTLTEVSTTTFRGRDEVEFEVEPLRAAIDTLLTADGLEIPGAAFIGEPEEEVIP